MAGLTRPSTSFLLLRYRTWMPGTRAGQDEFCLKAPFLGCILVRLSGAGGDHPRRCRLAPPPRTGRPIISAETIRWRLSPTAFAEE